MNINEAAASFDKVESPGATEAESNTSEENTAKPVVDESELALDDTATDTTTEDGETAPADTEPTLYDVPYNGEIVQRTLEELIKGNMMERDYSHKRGLTNEIERRAEGKLNELTEVIGKVEADLITDDAWFNTEEARTLKEDDPGEYLQKFETHNAKIKRYQDAKTLLERDKADKRSKLTANESEKLITAIPDWLDAKVQKAEMPQVIETLKSVGYTQEDLDNMTSHQPLVLALELSKFRKIKATDISSKKVNNAPKSATPGNTGQIETTQVKTRKGNMANLKKTGKIRDAAALL